MVDTHRFHVPLHTCRRAMHMHVLFGDCTDCVPSGSASCPVLSSHRRPAGRRVGSCVVHLDHNLTRHAKISFDVHGIGYGVWPQRVCRHSPRPSLFLVSTALFHLPILFRPLRLSRTMTNQAHCLAAPSDVLPSPTPPRRCPPTAYPSLRHPISPYVYVQNVACLPFLCWSRDEFGSQS